MIDDLQWRHYIIQASLRRLLVPLKYKPEKIIASEFGVCDGMGSWFALRELERFGMDYEYIYMILLGR